jgi:succinate dehydrogenase/fumarate reductase flavoprotein subunit
MQNGLKWPYRSQVSECEYINADVLVLGGGIAGCMAAIAAARKGQKVVLVEKGATKRSGAGGSGSDHWESATTNPCSKITPEELLNAMLDDNDGYNNAISHYIECREGWDRLLDIEKMGGKIRDTEDEFKGADFRDEATKLMFAYDYKNRFTLRIWGTTFKPALENELKRLGVKIIDRVMVTSLLTKDGKNGAECVGATGFNTRTGKFYVFSSKASIMTMSRPARIWLFSAAYPGLCEFRPLQCIGDGHAMGWRIGAEFNMMEKSVRAEFSSAGRSFPPYSTGNNHNTWFGATLIDATGREIPYVDRDGKILNDVKSRFLPAKGQRYFLKGGNIEQAKYEYDGPETLPYEKLKEIGYKLPFYADLSSMPELERKVIWGMMVGQEGKTNVPVYKNYSEAGFDPMKHVLQCYGVGWTSASFLPQERQLFGLPGGFMNDWALQSNIPGLFVGGDSLFSSNCFGHAASTGYYAGRHAADYALKIISITAPHPPQVDAEMKRVYAPLNQSSSSSITWKELNEAISKTMQNYCAEVRCDEVLQSGIEQLERYQKEIVPLGTALNPHELTRLLEVFDILTVAQIILQASLARKQTCKKLEFYRSDDDGKPQKPFIVIRNDGEKVISREVPLDYSGDIKTNYEKFNADYTNEMAS